LSWLGQSQLYGGHLYEAIDVWRQSIAELTGASTGKSPSATARYNEAISRNWLADALREAGLVAEARQEVRRATTTVRALVEADASNRSWQFMLLQARLLELELSTLDAPALLNELDRLIHDLVALEAGGSVQRLHDHIRAVRLEVRVAQGAARERAIEKLRGLRQRLNKDLDANPGQMAPTRSLAQIDLDLFRYENPAKTNDTCDLALDDTKRMQAWVGVDYVITAYWRSLERCDAAKHLRPSVEDARSWLARSKCGVLCTQTR
jgi:hypothetical protein